MNMEDVFLWILWLSNFESSIVPPAGIKHQIANATYRLQTGKTDNTKLNEEIQVSKIAKEMFNNYKTEKEQEA